MKTIAKNLLFLLIITSGIFIPAHALKSLKKAAQKPEEQFLEALRKTVKEEKARTIARLEASKNPKKQAKAKELKKRSRLDHIKIVTEGGKTTYLQLEDSRIFLQSYYPYDQQKLEKKLQELCKKHGLNLQNITEVWVHLSAKRRDSSFFGGLWTNNDLYSAAFYLGTTKAENPSKRDFIRSQRRSTPVQA